MNRYLILIYGDEEAFAGLPPEQAKQMIEALEPFEAIVAQEGRLVSTQRLHPAKESTLIKIRGGQTSVIDGPFTESKEQLGGYYLVEAASEDHVLGWLKLIPPLVDSTLEVRRVIDEERSVP